MKLGILETGQIPDTLTDAHGDYPQMFERLIRSADPEWDFSVYHVTEGQLPTGVDECDAWLVTGSRHGVYDPLPWIDPLKHFLKQAYDAGVPTVGICFGHQILAEALGGRATKSDKGWGLGAQRYNVHRKPSWMSGSADEVVLNAMHQDQIVRLPEEAEVLAGSEFCPFAVLAYRGNAMSIQPHPEFLTDFLRELIEYRRSNGSISDADADKALETLDTPIHTRQAAEWITGFLKERLESKRKSA